MVTYEPRSAWTSKSRGGATLTGSKLVGVSVHYPAAGNVTIGTSRDGAIRRLQGYWNFHVNTRGWSDIGYQVCVDQAGRVWDLRGITRVPAASASDDNPDANHEWGACLFLVGNNEPPSDAAVEAFQHWRTTRWLDRWPRATRIIGHGQVPGAQTECPGARLRRLIADGVLARSPEEDDVVTTAEMDEIARRTGNHILNAPLVNIGTKEKPVMWSVGHILSWLVRTHGDVVPSPVEAPWAKDNPFVYPQNAQGIILDRIYLLKNRDAQMLASLVAIQETLSQLATGGQVVDYAQVQAAAERALQRVEISIEPDSEVRALTAASTELDTSDE